VKLAQATANGSRNFTITVNTMLFVVLGGAGVRRESNR
jgi:hypothetical protein